MAILATVANPRPVPLSKPIIGMGTCFSGCEMRRSCSISRKVASLAIKEGSDECWVQYLGTRYWIFPRRKIAKKAKVLSKPMGMSSYIQYDARKDMLQNSTPWLGLGISPSAPSMTSRGSPVVAASPARSPLSLTASSPAAASPSSADFCIQSCFSVRDTEWRRRPQCQWFLQPWCHCPSLLSSAFCGSGSGTREMLGDRMIGRC